MIRLFSFLFILILSGSCSRKLVPKDPIPVHSTFTIESTHVEETRVINVWTPSSYAESDKPFPILYMLDGGINEDFPHIANTVAALIAEGRIPNLILVGIENTNRRRDLSGSSDIAADSLYCPLTDGAKEFRAFITNELFPEIEKRYRVSFQRGIIGESLAGLFIMETLFLQPDAFDYYIAMDPSLWWNNHYLVQHAESYLSAFPDRKIKLWFAGSGAEDISVHTSNLAKTLKRHAPATLSWTYSDEPEEKHSTIFRATKEKALLWIFSPE